MRFPVTLVTRAALVPLLVVALAGCKTVSSQIADSGPLASGGLLTAEQAAFDVTAYRLELAVDPAARTIEGQLTMTARLLADLYRLVLDLDDPLEVEALIVNGAPREFIHENGRLTARLEPPLRRGGVLTAVVHYGGQPREAPRPPWEGGFTWATTEAGQPWIATTCQGEGADLWWPCKDHPSDKPDTMDLVISVPDGLVVASNGTLRSSESNGDGTTTWHWHIANPISNYNVALNIAPYEALRTTHESVTGETFPVVFYVLPESVEQGRAFLPQISDHLSFFEELLGPYPFRNEKYGVVQTPHLGMEHQTIIAYGNKFRTGDPEGYDWLHHHELSHEWWGNLVTCRNWKDMWIHEGFGTYMQALYLESRYGEDAYHREMAHNAHRIHNKRAVAPFESHDSHQIYFGPDGNNDSDIYSKGSWVLHSLRWLMGDEAFFSALRRAAYPTAEHELLTDGSQVRFASTLEIREIFSRAHGQSLDWFFVTYVRQPALPELVVARDGEQLSLRWVSAQSLAFEMPVEIVVDGESRRIEMPGGSVLLELPAGAVVEIDPLRRVLRVGDEWPADEPASS